MESHQVRLSILDYADSPDCHQSGQQGMTDTKQRVFFRGVSCLIKKINTSKLCNTPHKENIVLLAFVRMNLP